MRNVLLGVLGGLIVSILYRKYKGVENNLPTYTGDNEDKRILLYDAPLKRERKCLCDTQYCTCGKHIV